MMSNDNNYECYEEEEAFSGDKENGYLEEEERDAMMRHVNHDTKYLGNYKPLN